MRQYIEYLLKYIIYIKLEYCITSLSSFSRKGVVFLFLASHARVSLNISPPASTIEICLSISEVIAAAIARVLPIFFISVRTPRFPPALLTETFASTRNAPSVIKKKKLYD